MNCNSAKQKKIVETTRDHTVDKNSRGDSDNIRRDCKNMGQKSIVRPKKPQIIEFNKVLQVSNASDSCPRALKSKKVHLYPPVMSKQELDRLRESSKFKTLEERVEEMNRQRDENKRLEDESSQRKKLLKDIDDARLKAKIEKERAKKTTTADDLGDDEKAELLEKAFMAKFEQEEEIKLANRIIMNAKCHIVRNAQIYEKNELQKELTEEGLRLDRKMIDTAMDELRKEDEKELMGRAVRGVYSKEIRKQIEERENKRIMEAGNVEEEIKMLAKINAAIKRDDELKAKNEREKRENLRKDLDQVVQSTKFFKKIAFDQDKASEMQIQAYMKAREARERKFELERNIAKEAAARRQQQLYNTQKKVLDQQMDSSDAALRHEQENREREFRQKEMEAALKKKKTLEDIKQSRNDQLNAMKQRQALQMARNEEDFNKTIAKLKEEEQKSVMQNNQRLQNRDKYREEIINQMNRKEMERREMKLRSKNEYLAWKEKEATRDKNIRTIIQAKLKAMKDANLPDKYIKDVEKQLKSAIH